MKIAEKRDYIQNHLNLANEGFIDEIYQKMLSTVNEPIVGYDSTGKPICQQQLIADLKEAEAQIERGEYTTLDELEKRFGEMVIQNRRVIISYKARQSLRAYIEYLKNEVSEETAEHVRCGILDKCRQLKDFSGFSKERYLEHEPVDYRSVTKWNYNIIYTGTEVEVRILNIIH